MLAKVISFGLSGLKGYPVLVETDVYNGMPAYETVGLPDAAVKESKERVRSAINNSGYAYPAKRITVNLAPADLRKEGPIYDLPIAVGLLAASGQIDTEYLRHMIMVGELSLNGDIRGVCGVLPMVIEAKAKGYKYFVLPADNADEASYVEGIKILPVRSLSQLADILNKKIMPEIAPHKKLGDAAKKQGILVDFADIKGQSTAKRAIEIAAAGGHNILLIGSPGTGKSMIAKALPGILPDMTFDEALEVTKIHSIAGELRGNCEGIISKRPIRSPHHTSTSVALLGGGSKILPGEISLAHNGVLFLDELPEFPRDVREALRQPMEDKVVSISRANSKMSYPANFMLIASMNPCPCGYYGSESHKCRCSQSQISNYLSKISGPFLDRIDIHVEMGDVKYGELAGGAKEECSADIKKRVDRARKIQLARYKKLGLYCNAQLNSSLIREYGSISADADAFLKTVYESMGLSARSYGRILLVSRTIADIEGSESVEKAHIAEAIRYRSLDRKYWGTFDE